MRFNLLPTLKAEVDDWPSTKEKVHSWLLISDELSIKFGGD